ncbi:MAG: cyclopropane-fatty-acyl-phospholipid synthase family protein [Planctomycetia bacterium]|nr:cyclopropane-fatty-acyl-phospholipid synthase family protein [Planctomycetia bacterium]
MAHSLSDSITAGLIDAVEQGWTPLPLVRLAIRRLCAAQLRALTQGGPEVAALQQLQFRDQSLDGPIAHVPELANAQHYEVPAEFYRLVLGPRLKYSSCYWADGVDTLAEAEVAALRETALHAELEDGQRVLELGCGWGSLTFWMLERYPNLTVTAVSNSHSQRRHMLAEASRRGFSERLRVITADMNDFEADDEYDRVVSVEMFEHLRNHRRALERIASWLAPGGKLFVHIFCHRQYAYAFGDGKAADWMGRNFFSGGMMPSDRWLDECGGGMLLEQQWRWNGRHYARTAAAWIANMERHRGELLDILTATHGRHEAARWFRKWRLLFLAGEEMFGMYGGEEWYVSHYRFAPAAQRNPNRQTTLSANGKH